MTTFDYLRILHEEIHTVVMATADDSGLPVTCAVDILDHVDESLYFLTSKGKTFYKRLKKTSFVALTGAKGTSTLNRASISLRGKVREVGNAMIPELLEKNPFMKTAYPTEEARRQLTVFQLYEGTGEWFDFTKKPIERAYFSFGGGAGEEKGFFITARCVGCGTCINSCPQDCISENGLPFVIDQQHCMHCGNCMDACPENAIVERR
ncbi:MAG: 4Fe-4S binding protein [Clostridia bacterium]|nr:4Fe-4S binding protein [Clostridia bacterium]MBR0025531.1 4Fe-4S binding protein [Clostridia bacterium]